MRIGDAGSRRVAVFYNDVSERKRAEAALAESAERQGFLLRLSDALRAEPNADAIANRALRMLFEQMRLDRCYVRVYRLAEDIGEFSHQVYDDRLLPLPAQVRLSDFPESLEVAFDRTLVIDDVTKMGNLSGSDQASFSALGMRALIAATLRKGQNNPLWAINVISARLRVWTQGKVSLVEDVAERTWAVVERSRAEVALRESEERFRQFSDASTSILWIRDTATLKMVFASPAFDTIYGIPGPDHGGDPSLRSWARLIKPDSRKIVFDNFRRVRNGGAHRNRLSGVTRVRWRLALDPRHRISALR